MTPRLAVTQEQADVIRWGSARLALVEPLTLRLPERPTMRPECHVCEPDCALALAAVPIPEGTRVRVEYPCDVCDGSGRGSLDGRPQDWLMCGECNGKGWHPVALATLTEVHAALADGQPYRWYVTLSDIKPVEADQ